MKVVELLEKRRDNWRQLEQLCVRMESRRRRSLDGAAVVRFAALYRAACADLALADAYQLPSNTVHYLHQLVGRAHNQLYRSRRFDLPAWGHELFQAVPRRLYRDNCLRLAFVIFWGLFLASMMFARSSRHYSEGLVGKEQLREIQEMYEKPLDRRDSQKSSLMTGFYIQHNTSIGLECFAWGLLFGVGGLVALVFNAAQIGAIFGFMTTVGEWGNFYQFVTAHGPFELTAVVLSAAAGMRLGFSLIDTKGMSRLAALRQAGREAMPTMGAAMAMFALAGLIEAFVSPSPAPFAVKVVVALVSAGLILFYVVILGRQPLRATEAKPTHAV
jgi:uncharacterized membrane protein SpoIIM required for sporulation